MTETIIFLCGVLSGLVTLLLGYFIRMGLLHNNEIKILKVDVESSFRCLEEYRNDIQVEIKKIESYIEKDIENLHNRIGSLEQQIQETKSYTDKRVDQVLDKFNIKINKTA